MPHFLCPVKEAARFCPQKCAIARQNERVSYGELNQNIEKAQKKVRGKKILLCHPPTIHSISVLFAAFRENSPVFIGSFRLPFSELIKKGRELGCSLFIATEKEKEMDAAVCTLDDVFALPDVSGQNEPYLEEDSPSVLLMTSGSTAIPKIAQLTLGNLYYNAPAVISCVNLQENDNWLLSLPLFHVGGLSIIFRSFLAKATLSLPCSTLTFAENLQSLQPTHLSLVPTQLLRLLNEKNTAFFKNLKCLLLGGAPISQSLYEEGKARHLPLFLTYGLTEMASAVVITDVPKIRDGRTFLGHPLPFRELKVEDGEIFVKGKTLFYGYHPEKMSGWFATRDFGVFDEQLGLAILGRKDRLFISGGENIQPEEIERALLQLPEIVEAIVVPKKHPEFDAVPFAFVRFSKKIVAKKNIFERLKEILPKFKIPVCLYDLDTLSQDSLKPNLPLLAQIANEQKL